MGCGSGDNFSEIVLSAAQATTSPPPWRGRVVELASVSELAEPGRGGERVFQAVVNNHRCPPLPSFAKAASRQAALPSPAEGEEAMWLGLRMDRGCLDP